MSDRERLLAQIDARLTRYLADGDSALIMASEALAEAESLQRMGSNELSVAYPLAMLYFHRSLADSDTRPAAEAESDARTALSHFRVVYEHAPDMLPDALRDFCADEWGGGASQAAAWHARAMALLQSFRTERDPLLLDDMVWLLRRTVAASRSDPAGGPRYSGYLSNLGLSLRTRFDAAADESDIDEAVRVGTDAVSAASTETGRAVATSNLAVSHISRFEHYGRPADLAQAVHLFRQVVAVTPHDAPGRSGRLSNLGSALASQFITTGETALLDEAITWLGSACEAASEGPGRAEHLSNLGAALLTRFRHRGAVADVDLAVDCGHDAVAEAGSGSRFRPLMLNNLGLALRTRFQRTGGEADIDDAVQALREALDIVGDGPRSAMFRSSLSTALRVRFDRFERPEDIDEAVRLGREAAAAAVPDPARRAMYSSNLGAALSRRFQAAGDPRDLDDALGAEREAVRLMPPDNPMRAVALANLGLAASRRAEHHDRPEDWAEAAQAYDASARIGSAPAHVRATSAQDCGRLRARTKDWQGAGEAFGLALELLAVMTDHRLVRDDHQHHISTLAELACDAAAAALSGGDAERALALLEKGRGVMAARSLMTRGELTKLREQHLDLATELEGVRRQLDAPLGEASSGTHAARRQRLALEYDRLLRAIRRLEGFERFLIPDDGEELVRLAGEGPVVAVNVSEHRCDALVLSPQGVRHVPLPRLTRADVLENADSMLKATHDPDWDSNPKLTAILKWLWEVCAQPVLEALEIFPAHEEQDPVRLWWMPTGPLCLLPLHAAGLSDDPGSSILELTVSSYTPTLRSLNAAAGRLRPKEPAAPLIVAVPQAPDQPPLPVAEQEAALVADRLQGPADMLVGTDATRDRVLAALPSSTTAHFACHAVTDLDDPSETHLVLTDGSVCVREISELHIEAADLVFLSACSTAFSGVLLLDEVIHISSAFQLAGFPHAIGTLWPVGDSDALAVTGTIYRNLADRSPAEAVRAGALRSRQNYPANPYLWASHVHTGP